MDWIEKISRKQALALFAVGYLFFSVNFFELSNVGIETNIINVWNEIIKSVDPKRVIDDSVSPKDFATK